MGTLIVVESKWSSQPFKDGVDAFCLCERLLELVDIYGAEEVDSQLILGYSHCIPKAATHERFARLNLRSLALHCDNLLLTYGTSAVLEAWGYIYCPPTNWSPPNWDVAS